jgi:hypothetical protein
VKIRDAQPAELAPKPIKPRELSPRQLAIRKRELVIGKALRELATGPKSLIKKVELDEGEKLPAMRAAIAKQIKEQRSGVHLAVRNGAIYLTLGPLPRRGQRGE